MFKVIFSMGGVGNGKVFYRNKILNLNIHQLFCHLVNIQIQIFRAVSVVLTGPCRHLAVMPFHPPAPRRV